MSASTANDEFILKAAPVPRGEKRRQEIAAVAERVFSTHGFAEATMQMIASVAGASKETLYRHFGSKEGLFSEIVENRANRFLHRLDEDLRKPGSLPDVLFDLGFRLLEKMMGDDGLWLCRIVISEGLRSPDLGRIFYERGPERLHKRLAEFLVIARERGELQCEDAELASHLFLGAVVSQYSLKALVLPDRAPLTRAQMEAHVTEAVTMFLARFGTGRKAQEASAQVKTAPIN